jgi:hypothetical protein
MHFASCSQKKDNPFVEKIIGDYSRNSYFVLIGIKSSTATSMYLIENDDLFYYYHQQKGYNEKQYQEFIKPLLSEEKSIMVSSDDIKKYGFTAITSAKLEEEMKKDKSYLLQKYFANHVLKDGISIEERNVIIAVLFNWKIASRIDDESGYLIYHEQDHL